MSDSTDAVPLERTYCNPLPLPDYPRGRASVNRRPPSGDAGEQGDFRETADPSVIWHDGRWYLYPSCGMAYVSEDFVNWRFVPMNIYDVGYAPTVMEHRGAFYLTAFGAGLYRAATPLGPWSDEGPIRDLAGNPMHLSDPMYFADDDGQVYLYWGCGAPGIFGCRMDPDNPGRAASAPEMLFAYDPGHEWERFGEFNEDPSTCWLEGAWMVKAGGRYYLTYAAPGTQWRTYGMGAYVSGNPLGPFVYQSLNPILRTTGGLVRGPGHGCIVRGPNETLWAFYTCTVCYRHMFERRIGMDPAGVDAGGRLFVRGASEMPQWAPGVLPRPQDGNDAGLLPLSQARRCSASSSSPGRTPSYAFDGSLRTWWQAAAGDEIPWVEADLESVFDVSAVRVCWAEPNLNYDAGVKPGPMKYRVEGRATDDAPWTVLLDRTGNGTDLLIDYRTFPTREVRFARLVVTGSPAGVGVGVADFSLFGRGRLPPAGKYGKL